VDYIFHCLSQLALQLRLFSFTLKSHEARIRRLEKKVKELSGE
jgi:hypothetical protein